MKQLQFLSFCSQNAFDVPTDAIVIPLEFFPFSCASSRNNMALPAHSADITCLCYVEDMDCCRDIRAPWSPDTNKTRSTKKTDSKGQMGTVNNSKECFFTSFLISPVTPSLYVALLCMERYWSAIVEITLDFFGRSALLLWYGWCPQKWIKQMDFNNIWLNAPFRARGADPHRVIQRPATQYEPSFWGRDEQINTTKAKRNKNQ